MKLKITEVPSWLYHSGSSTSNSNIAIWTDIETDLEEQEKYPIQEIVLRMTAGDVVVMTVRRYDPSHKEDEPLTFEEGYVVQDIGEDGEIKVKRGLDSGKARPRGMPQEVIDRMREDYNKLVSKGEDPRSYPGIYCPPPEWDYDQEEGENHEIT